MKKKMVAAICMMCMSAQLSGCSNETANDTSLNEEEILDIEYSSDFSDGNTASITFHDINLEIPNNWTEGDSTEEMLYFYPDNGMLSVGYEMNGGDLSPQENKDSFISGFLDSLESPELLNQENITIGITDVEAVSFDFEFTNNDELYYGTCAAFNVDTDLYCIFLATETSSTVSYEKDYQNIVSSVLTPMDITYSPEPTESPTPEPTEVVISTPEPEEIPADYLNALDQAQRYSELMHMSKQGIYDQLISEYGGQFSAEAAQYAIDNVSADWNANALAKAQSYSDTMYMSKQGIYDQLTSEYGEQFTAEEAQYAVDNLQTDYNRNALEKAKSYQENMDMSPEDIRDQLTSEYGDKFTQEEADYAIENLNK